MIEYLCTSDVIKSPVCLHNKASFVKFGLACGIEFDKISSFLSFLRVPGRRSGRLRGGNSCLKNVWNMSIRKRLREKRPIKVLFMG